MTDTKEFNGLNYYLPEVFVLNDSGIGVPEIAARTCYDSFYKSENDVIKNFAPGVDNGYNDIVDSDLLDTLAWVHFHHSIIEHSTISFLIKGTSRGVLQEYARHRIQAISVRSTRYTMGDIINQFIYCNRFAHEHDFIQAILGLDMFVTADDEYNVFQAKDIWNKLQYQYNKVGQEEFYELGIAKSSLSEFIQANANTGLEILNKVKKRNVGDSFKHLVNDNWKVDLVSTFNLRALKNFLDLRGSNAAWFQINWLAEIMKGKIDVKYLKLIDKKYKHLNKQKSA